MIKLLILLLISTTQQRCLEGCLRCSADNKCLYCDVLNGYQLRSERCVKPQIPNCLLTDEKFNCLLCSNQHYLNRTLNQCVELIPEIKAENCEIHEGPNMCQLCQKNFYLKNGACTQIAQPISNCRIENDRGICLECEPEFIRSVDKKLCQTKPDIQNCGTHKWVSCRKCASNFLNNDNFYFDILFNFDKQKDSNILHQQRKNLSSRNAEGIKFPACQKIRVDNCLVYDTFDRCKQCVTGYFVNQKRICQQNPIGTIKNCLRYSSSTNCISCSQGYHLKDQKCSKVYNIENCMIYKQDAQTTVCTRCFDDYYLSAENLCSKRTDLSNIPLCMKLSFKFEKCEQCLQGYITTQDGFRCLAIIKNCLKYQDSNKNDTFLKCSLCQSGFYYNQLNRICIKGTVANCMKFDQFMDQCVECNHKYYLVENKCEPQAQLKFCNNYHKTTPNQCVGCDQNSFLFTQIQSCQKVDTIPRCEVYGSKASCNKCKDGYYLKNSSECKQIDLRENCLQKVDANCVKCLPHFALLQGKCVKGYDWLIQGCQSTNLDGNSQLQQINCNSCRKNYVPINAKETYQCHEVQTLHREFNMNKDQSFDKDCLQYRFDINGVYQCVKCVENRVLVEGKCRENCYQVGKLTVYRQWITLHNKTGDALNDAVRVDQTNVCEKTIPNCAVASLDIDQDFVNVKYSCEQCMKGFIPVIDLPHYGNVVRNQVKEKELNVHMPLTQGPGVICIDPLQEMILGDVDQIRKQIDFCQYYVRISKNSFGCRTCLHGKTGKVIQAIKRCRVFKNPQACLECDQGFYLKSENECRPIIKIENCDQYDEKHNVTKCTKCLDSHFLDNLKCIPRVNSIGKENCDLKVNEDVCICKQGYVIHPNTQICLKKPDNCLEGNVQGETILCTSCAKKFAYLENNQCKIGTVAFCDEFHDTQNSCIKCQNGYFLQNNTCKQHTSNLDSLCDIWSQGTKDVCDKCKPEATKFKKIKHCKSVNEEIPNCKVYSDIFSCKECEDNYYLNNVSKRCLKIPPSTHCLKLKVVDLSDQQVYDKNDYTEKIRYVYSCDKCETNYYRRQYSVNEKYYVDSTLNTQSFNLFQCVDWLNYHTKNCTETQINGVENLGNFCYGCSSNFMPLLVPQTYVCVNKLYLPQRKNGFTINQNCRAYEFTADRAMKCTQCKNNFYLDTNDNNSCRSETDGCTGANDRPFAFFIDTDNQVKKWVCGLWAAGSITNCVSYVISIKQTSNTNPWTRDISCFKCDSTSYPIIETLVPAIKNLTAINVLDGELNIKYHDQLFPALKCSTQSPKGVTQASVIKNCAVYREDHATATKLLCARCKQGYHGRVYLDATHYGIEACEKMTSCSSSQNALSGLHLNTPWMESKLHPIALFSCQKCTEANKIPVAFMGAMSAYYGNGVEIFSMFRTSFAKTGVAGTEMSKDSGSTLLTVDNQPANSYQTQCWDENKIVAITQPTAVDVLTYSDAGALPTNCGLVVVDTTSAKNNAFCVACKSGYSIASYDLTNTFAVKTCDIVPNCTNNANEALNRCSGCVYGYDSVTDTVSSNATTNCIASKQGNCFAGIMNGNILSCHICDPGYELINNKCLIINVPNCKAKKSNIFNSFNKTHKVIAERYFQYSWVSNQLDIQGCVECESPNDILYYNSSNDDYIHPAVCSQIMDTNGNYSASDNTSYISTNQNLNVLSNCQRYGYKSNKYICVECITNYRMNTNDYSCQLITSSMTDLLPNCLIAESGNTTICQKCQTNYVNIGGLCRINTNLNFVDANCIQISSAQKNNYQSICSKCKLGYYAKNIVSPFNKCVPIPTSETNCQDYLDETGCVDCAPGYGLMLIKQLNSDQTKRVCVKMDLNTQGKYIHDQNCDKLTVVSNTESLNQQRLICRKCLPHSVLTSDFIQYKEQCYPVISPISECIEYDSPIPTADILNAQLQLIESKDFKCNKCSDIKNYYLDRVQNKCLQRSAISDCKEYDQLANRCKKCEQGFELQLDMKKCKNYKNNTNLGYLDVCRDIEGCKSNNWHEGLDKTLSSVYSCHQCQKSDQIPFAIGTLKLNEQMPGLETLENINEVTNQFTPWQNTDIDPQQQVQCLQPSNTTFGMIQSDFTFPTNCALGFINIQPLLDQSHTHNSQHSTGLASPALFDFNKTTVRCHACKPGFAPTKQKMTLNGQEKELKFLITACSQIQNCENSTWFNGCSQCVAGFAHAQENGRTRFDTCVSVPEVHKECWAFDQTTQRCTFCKKGTYLNKDNVCELINTPNCEHREFRFGQIQTLNNLLNGMYFSPNFIGCNKCQKGFVGVWIPKTKSVCVNSLYHVNSSYVQNTLFVKNCVEYYLDRNVILRCNKCADGLVRSRDQRNCFNSASLANCQEATSDGVCLVCIDEFINVDGVCEKGAIAGCIRYVDNRNDCPLCNKHEQICQQCSPEKYLEGNQCIDGIIQNCKVQETAKICKQCEENFTLILSKKHTSYCYPNDPRYNCKAFVSDFFQAQVLQCAQCKDSTYILSNSETDKSLTTCTQFIITQNCLKYDNNPITLGNSSFRCVECIREFYLNGPNCAKRNIMPNECIDYDLQNDNCMKCQNGYFISIDGKQCVPYPQGISGCERYLSENTCIKCLPGYYEKEDGCELVEIEIPNCVYYEDPHICKQCAPEFYQMQGKCVQVFAKNCQTVETPYACLNCNDNAYLQTLEGVTSCVNTTIVNCLKINKQEPYDCLKCQGDFYPNKQECTTIPTLIKDCIEYETPTLCRICSPPSTLSVDRSSCIKTPESLNHIDLNCQENIMNEKPVCNTCQPGFIFQYGKCIACNTGLGCFVCDPNNRSRCLMCSQGFIMTPEGSCMKPLQESSGLDDMARSLREMNIDDVVLMRL